MDAVDATRLRYFFVVADEGHIGRAAARLGITQPSLSKLENQEDMQVSTLRRLIQALGGELEIIAHLPRGDIRILQFNQTITNQSNAAV